MKKLYGFINIKTLVIIIIILVILGLAGVSVEDDIVENEGVQENTSYVATGVVYVWDTYLKGPASYLWNDIFVDLIWESFIVNMQALRNGDTATNFELQGDLPYPSLGEYVDNYDTEANNQ